MQHNESMKGIYFVLEKKQKEKIENSVFHLFLSV